MKSEQSRDDAPMIWAITDSRIGNAVQARALAEAAARRIGGRVEAKTIAPRPPLHLLPAALWAAPVPRAGGWPFSGLTDRGAALASPWPAMAIGCGRRAAPIVAAVARLSGARSAQILAPGMATSAFDRVIVPQHDRLSGPNVLRTLGALNGLDAATLAEAAARWRPRLGHLPEPRVAVLVGGPSRSAAFGAGALGRLCDGLTRIAVDGAGLMVTPSRRTPRAVVDRLAEVLAGVGGWLWSGVGENPYPGLLGLADAVVATADSVNMASEAASTGKPVLIAPVDRVDPKFARFHDALATHGAARPFDGALDFWSYPPLREAERVADALVALPPAAGDGSWPARAEGLNAKPR